MILKMAHKDCNTVNIFTLKLLSF